MTPQECVELAAKVYSMDPMIGVESKSAKAVYLPADIDGLVFAFPGTENLAGWLADITVDPIVVPGFGKVHEGFWIAYSSIRNELLTVALTSNKPVTVVGHSLGAALAILFAADLALLGHVPKAVFAFAPPRVSACNTIAELFGRTRMPVSLYRKGEDIVPLVPRVLHNWQHPAQLIQIGSPLWDVPNVEDHFVRGYVTALVAPQDKHSTRLGNAWTWIKGLFGK